MITYISILRGINVSGTKKTPMKELLAQYEALGFTNVATYIQSGNLVFQSAEKDTRSLISQIEEKLKGHFGFEIPVLLRTAGEMKSVLEQNPFLKEQDIQTDKLHVTFLAQQPEASAIEKVQAYDFSPDRFILAGREIYVYCPNGYGRTKINNNFFEAKLKVGATTRNWKTVNVLADMAGKLAGGSV